MAQEDPINHAIDKASEGLTAIANAISSHAPQAWALAVHGTFAQGVATLIIGGIFFSLFLLLFSFTCWLARKAFLLDKEHGGRAGEMHGAGAIITGIVSGILMFLALLWLCSPDAWAKVISPDGYLATQLLQKVVGG